MSLLEDRITRILEMRIAGYDDHAIADDLGIGVSALESYEASTQRSVQNIIAAGKQNSVKIAKELGVSPIIVEMLISHYKIETLELSQFQTINGNKISTQEQNYSLIRQAIENGAKSVEEVMDKTGFNRKHLNKLAFRGNIKLPGRDYRTKEDKVDYIRQASGNGKSINIIAGDLGVTRKTVVRYASEANINLHGVDYRTKEDILNAIRLATKEGQSAEIIAEYVGFSRKTVVKYASKANIRLHGVNYKSAGLDLETEVKTTRRRHRNTIEKVIAIREAYLNGAYTIDAVMETAGMTKFVVEEYAQYAGINFSVRQRKSKEREYAIRQAIANGADSEDAIKEQVGLAIPTIRRYASKNDIRLTGRDYRTREQKIIAIQQAKENGYTSLGEIAKQVQLTESFTYSLIKNEKINVPGINLPVRPGIERRPEIDEFVNRGATLQEMVNELGQTRETMRLYINHSGQYRAWRENRKQAQLLAKQG